jgi:hypothetical protein
MKIDGRQVKPNVEILVLPRLEGDVVIRAKAVTINEDFEKLVPEVVPPGVRTKEGFKKDYKDETYLQMVAKREEKRFAYMVLRSLEPSKIEWDTVDLDKPETWTGWKKEMEDEEMGGFAEVETNRIVMTCMAANSLDEAKIKAARDHFLLGQGE